MPYLPSYTVMGLTMLLNHEIISPYSCRHAVRTAGAPSVIMFFPLHEYWLDIGQMKDFEQAQNAIVGWEK